MDLLAVGVPVQTPGVAEDPDAAPVRTLRPGGRNLTHDLSICGGRKLAGRFLLQHAPLIAPVRLIWVLWCFGAQPERKPPVDRLCLGACPATLGDDPAPRDVRVHRDSRTWPN